MFRKLLFLFLPIFLSVQTFSAEGTVYVVEPVLVKQPVYDGMDFHVYRPYNFPNEWFLTFDGFPVTKTPSGVWVYGMLNGSTLVPSQYVVGSVNPSSLPRSQHVIPASVSSVSCVLMTPLNLLHREAPREFPLKPFSSAGAVLLPTYIPSWSVNPSFTAIASWNRLVDRIGILEKPSIPIAWKGDRPKAVFAWTGKRWHQIVPQSTDIPEKPSEILKNHLYSLTRMVHSNGAAWKDEDIPLLAQQASVWGYLWMGKLSLVTGY